MPVLRQHHTRDFTVIPNALLQDQRLSLRDVGLLVWMLSKPEDWKFTKKTILAEIRQDGDRSLQAAVKNLQDTGYLTITRGDRKMGKLAESIWTVYDEPQMQNAVVEQLESEKPECGSPQLRFPSVQNAVDYKINNNKKKKAVPAVEDGAQPSKELYRDPETGEWRRKENT